MVVAGRAQDGGALVLQQVWIRVDRVMGTPDSFISGTPRNTEEGGRGREAMGDNDLRSEGGGGRGVEGRGRDGQMDRHVGWASRRATRMKAVLGQRVDGCELAAVITKL